MKRFPSFRVLAFTALFLAVACMASEAQQQRGGRQRGQRGEGGAQQGGAQQRGPQRGPGGGGFGQRGPGMMGGGISNLLRSEQVQKEIKVTEDQKSQLTKLSEAQRAEMRERFAGRGGENREEQSEAQRQAQRETMMKEFQERAKKTEEKIRGILTAEQFKRLKQIELQQQGVEALRRPDMAQALGLTEEQIQKLKEIFDGIQKQREEIGEQSRSLFQGFRDASEDERAKLREKGEQLRAKGENLRKESQQKAMAVLNDEQKGKLKAMMGEPFKLERGSMPGRPGGDRGGQRPGGDRGGQGGGNQQPQGGRRPARPQA